MSNLAYIVLPALVAATAFLTVRDRAQYQIFKALVASEDRQATLRRWVLESFLLFGVMSVVCLFAIGHASALRIMPLAFEDISAALHSAVAGSTTSGFLKGMLRGFAMLILPALLFGHTASALIRTYSEHKRGQKITLIGESKFRDIHALFPRNARERRWTTLLSLNAGLSEELFFRLLAPLLFWLVTGNALLAVIAATLWFGLAHYYQGVGGVAVSALLGAVLMAIYLYTGSIWLVVVIHAVLDLNDLSIAPWFAEWLAVRSSGTSSVQL